MEVRMGRYFLSNYHLGRALPLVCTLRLSLAVLPTVLPNVHNTQQVPLTAPVPDERVTLIPEISIDFRFWYSRGISLLTYNFPLIIDVCWLPHSENVAFKIVGI